MINPKQKINCKECLKGNCKDCLNEDCLCRENHGKRELEKTFNNMMSKFVKEKNLEQKFRKIEHQSLRLTEYANKIMEKYSFKTLNDTNEILFYSDGVYKTNGENLIKIECQEMIPECIRNDVNEIIEIIRRCTFIDRSEFNKHKEIICLENCLFDLETFSMEIHNPSFLTTVKLPIKYDPEAKCPKFIKFLREVLPDPEDTITAIEEFANILLADRINFGKCAMYIGKGQNGKSTFLKIITGVIGTDNISNVSIHDLNSRRFTIADLFGMYANIYPDISKQEIEHLGLFKQAVSGDRMRGERKNQQPFNFNPFAKHFFSANEMPDFKDDTDAIFTRILITKWPNQFIKNRIKDLDKKILEKEKAGIFNLLLHNYRRLIVKDGFTYEQSIKEVRNEIKIQADKIREFVDSCIIEDINEKESSGLVYQVYVKWCKGNKIDNKSNIAFKNKLLGLGFRYDKAYLKGTQTRCFIGLKLNPNTSYYKELRNLDNFE